jgi:hypothetical protein
VFVPNAFAFVTTSVPPVTVVPPVYVLAALRVAVPDPEKISGPLPEIVANVPNPTVEADVAVAIFVAEFSLRVIGEFSAPKFGREVLVWTLISAWPDPTCMINVPSSKL